MHFDSFFYVPNMCVSPNVTTTICFEINMQGISTAKMNCLVACIIWSVRILILLFPINTIWCTCCYCLHYNYLAIFINLIQSFHSKSIRRGIIRPNKINYKFWHANSSVYQKLSYSFQILQFTQFLYLTCSLNHTIKRRCWFL